MANADCFVAVASLANATMFSVHPAPLLAGIASVMQSYSFRANYARKQVIIFTENSTLKLICFTNTSYTLYSLKVTGNSMLLTYE